MPTADFIVPVPEAKGKICRQTSRGRVYIQYILDRTYDPKKKYNKPKRTCIGRLAEDGVSMYPNENFFKFFPDTPLPERRPHAKRAPSLHAGPHIVFDRIIKDYRLDELLRRQFGRNAGLVLDLACYMIVEGQNQAQHYPQYALMHPLFTEGMHVFSDSKISDFLNEVTEEQILGFLSDWNAERDRSRIYVSYDSTNKNSQAGDISFVEFGNAKDDKGLPIVNIGVATEVTNQIPLFYDPFCGSINDVSQFECFVNKAMSYGYQDVGFILDRGYFSRKNIEYMDEHGFSFVMMVKGCRKLVHSIVDEKRDTFEAKSEHAMRAHDLSGTTSRRKLFEDDEKERFFHLYFSPIKMAKERREIDESIALMEKHLAACQGKKVELGDEYSDLFDLFFDPQDQLLFGQLKHEAVNEMYKRCGYFCIVTSEEMSALDAYELYRGRDVSEKLFSMEKTFLGSRSFRVHSDVSMSTKLFVEFIALIIRQRFYNLLKNEVKKLPVKKNYMTVPAALGELKKIYLTRVNNSVYQLDQPLTKTQQTILKAFGLTKDDVLVELAKITKLLKAADAEMPQKPEENNEEENDNGEA